MSRTLPHQTLTAPTTQTSQRAALSTPTETKFYCQLDRVSVRYNDTPALHDVTLQITNGERIALIGRSGAGKSTLLRLIYERARADTVLVPQDLALVRQLSVFHNIYSGRLREHGALYNLANLVRPFRSQIAQIEPLLVELGLEGKLFERVAALSGGQQQRTAVARALFQGSPALLADEPVSAVDENQARQVLDTIVRRHRTVILCMHDVALALGYATRLIGLQNGCVVLDSPAAEVTPPDLAGLYAV